MTRARAKTKASDTMQQGTTSQNCANPAASHKNTRCANPVAQEAQILPAASYEEHWPKLVAGRDSCSVSSPGLVPGLFRVDFGLVEG